MAPSVLAHTQLAQMFSQSNRNRADSEKCHMRFAMLSFVKCVNACQQIAISQQWTRKQCNMPVFTATDLRQSALAQQHVSKAISNSQAVQHAHLDCYRIAAISAGARMLRRVCETAQTRMLVLFHTRKHSPHRAHRCTLFTQWSSLQTAFH